MDKTQSKSIWRRPWTGWRALLLGIGVIVFLALFVAILGFGMLSTGGQSRSTSEIVAVALTISAIIVILVWLAFLCLHWLRDWRNLRKAVFVTACLGTCIALFYVEENWRGKRAWENHRRALEARGEKFDVASLAPPQVPDERNFALTPLLKPALDFTRVEGRAVWRDTNGWSRLQRIRADLPMKTRPGADDALALGNLEKGTFAEIENCRSFYRGNTNYPQPESAGSAGADIRLALSKFDSEVTQLREASAARPDCRFPLEYEYEPSFGILLPQLSDLKGLCTLLNARALADLETGETAAAFAELKLGFRISDSISAEPILIDHLVRIAMLSVNLQTVREGLLRHAWTDEQLAELDKYLTSLNLLAEFKLTMRGERALSVAGLDWVRRQRFGFEFEQVINGNSPRKRSFPVIPSGWFYQNMRIISMMHQEFTLPSVDENARHVNLEACLRLAHETASLGESRWHPYKVFAALLFPALNTAIIKSARMQTWVDAARVACALERYRLANGAQPDALAALVPRFIDSVPKDVMDGQPLRFRKEPDGGFVIYSIGWNNADDSGQLSWNGDKQKRVVTSRGDWVWRMPAN